MFRSVKTMPRTIFAQRLAESFRIRDKKAMLKGTSQKSAINTNIPALICISPSSSIAAGSMEAKLLWADIATAIKSHSTEILTFQVKRSISASFVFAAVSPNLKINEPSNETEKALYLV
jgi:hypothetical protein